MKYQYSAKGSNRLSKKTQLIPPVWPLMRWGIDIIGELPAAMGNLCYAVIAVEYFSKWVEAMPLVNVTSKNVQKFLWQNIICRFGIPHEVKVDNDTQFDKGGFKKFCEDLGIKVLFTSVYHP